MCGGGGGGGGEELQTSVQKTFFCEALGER